MKRIDWVLTIVIVVAATAAAVVHSAKAAAVHLDREIEGELLPAEGSVPHGTEVLAVIHPDCPYCQSSVEAWNGLLERRVRIVGVSLGTQGDADAFAATYDAAFPIIGVPDGEWEGRLGLRGVPYTLVL